MVAAPAPAALLLLLCVAGLLQAFETQDSLAAIDAHWQLNRGRRLPHVQLDTGYLPDRTPLFAARVLAQGGQRLGYVALGSTRAHFALFSRSYESLDF